MSHPSSQRAGATVWCDPACVDSTCHLISTQGSRKKKSLNLPNFSFHISTVEVITMTLTSYHQDGNEGGVLACSLQQQVLTVWQLLGHIITGVSMMTAAQAEPCWCHLSRSRQLGGQARSDRAPRMPRCRQMNRLVVVCRLETPQPRALTCLSRSSEVHGPGCQVARGGVMLIVTFQFVSC